jgi:predicted metal-dependent phosphoesterase TrpH
VGMKIKVDLHVHTSHSLCARLSPIQLKKAALRMGISAVAITDHNTMAGAREMQLAVQSLKIICAEEIRTNQGEIIGYFLQKEIPLNLSPKETVARIREQGGLVAVPHPFDRLRSSRLRRPAFEAIMGSIDMIEIFNARNMFIDEDPDLLSRVLAAGAVPIAASDAHLPIEVGRACMEMEDFSTPQEFLVHLRSATIVARKSPLWVHLVTKVMRNYRLLRKKNLTNKF